MLLNGELKNSNSLTQFRLLLRLLASLTCVNVIDAAQLLAVVGRLLESCLAIATASTQLPGQYMDWHGGMAHMWISQHDNHSLARLILRRSNGAGALAAFYGSCRARPFGMRPLLPG